MNDLTRRETLQKGTLLSGSVVLGSAALSGTAAAGGQGGSGFMWTGDFVKALDDDQTFTVIEDDGWTAEHSPGCSGKETAPTKTYTGYLIKFEEGVYDQYGFDTLGHLYVEANRKVKPDIWQSVTAVRECPPTGIVRDPNGTEYPQSLLKLAFKKD